ncbi:hypothetical protein EES44_24365 [Streptomyces sp. ADI96-15]|uniref:PIN domain-containing protein n=1 Tax=Streptomyces sp. ADI96-15 TaxID=1522761 RepID=UPI000F5548BD|nr:PIN domain-containing protein [Streptomyces sp. ADI96-15]RPK58204.1 hypothetical protein EES44_24365 [Streptomyces sp. ADI96-15]
MIILDSNILWDIKRDDPMADLLRVLRSTGTQKVAVPWLVLEELVGQQAIKYREKHEKAVEAERALAEASPWGASTERISVLPTLNLEHARSYWRGVYRDIVGVIPSSEEALREGAFREMNALAPCKKGQKGKTNFRDAVIWMSAVEYARENPSETVYFISKNTNDFGDGTSYQYPMADDIKGFGERFVHLTDGDEIVKRFTTQVSADNEEAATLVNSEETRSELSSLARRKMERRDMRFWFPARVLDSGRREWVVRRVRTWAYAPEVVFDSVRDIRAFGIGDHVWYTVRARWIVGGYAFNEFRNTIMPAACVWETLVLTSTSAPAAGMTLLRSEVVREATEEESSRLTFDEWEEDPADEGKPEPALTRMERVVRELSTATAGMHHLPPRARRKLDELRAEEGDM